MLSRDLPAYSDEVEFWIVENGDKWMQYTEHAVIRPQAECLGL